MSWVYLTVMHLLPSVLVLSIGNIVIRSLPGHTEKEAEDARFNRRRVVRLPSVGDRGRPHIGRI